MSKKGKLRKREAWRRGCNKNLACQNADTWWFKVTFWSPSWRSLNPLKGSLNQPKKVTLNHLVYCTWCPFLLQYLNCYYFQEIYVMQEVVVESRDAFCWNFRKESGSCFHASAYHFRIQLALTQKIQTSNATLMPAIPVTPRHYLSSNSANLFDLDSRAILAVALILSRPWCSAW